MSASELVIGAEGFVGKRLMELSGAKGTTRRNQYDHPTGLSYVNLLDVGNSEIPKTDVVYICAGINGAKYCEGNPKAYRTNVDGTIAVAKKCLGAGSFVVWISTCTLEWANSAYARQKERTEETLAALKNVGIVRAGRVTHDNRDSLCNLMMEIGRGRKEGIVLWNEEENPYAK